MSAEERWTRIENALAMLSEHQANAVVREEKHDRQIERIEKVLDRHIEFVTAAITKTAAAQEVTEERLQKLIDKVDEVDDRVGKLEKKNL